MPSQMHLGFISPLQSAVSSVKRMSGTAGDASWRSQPVGCCRQPRPSCPVLSQHLNRYSLWFWTQKQQRTAIPSSWYSSYCAACFPASYSLYSFPKWLQTGSIYLRNIVSRIISVLLTFSQSRETYQGSCSALPRITSACVRPAAYCQPSL